MQNQNWNGALRIWKDDGSEKQVNEYVLFRREFTLQESLNQPVLRICADTDYLAYLDGVEVARGQFSDAPDWKTWEDFALKTMTPGRHVLAFRVFYCGDNFQTYAPGRPGLLVRLFDANGFELVSDSSFRMLPDPAFQSGPIAKLTGQLGFTMAYDARQALDFAAPEFDDSAWQSAVASDPDKDVEPIRYQARPRNCAPRLCGFQHGKIIKQGYSNNDTEHPSKVPAAYIAESSIFWGHAFAMIEQFDGDTIPTEQHPVTVGKLDAIDGIGALVVLFDCGEELTGFLEFDLEASEGTIIRLAHGEHINDGRVRCHVGGRNFADLYVCHAGRNHFQFPFRRVGARYLEFHISNAQDDRVTFHRVGIRKWELALPCPTEFHSPDAQLNEVRKLAIRTLELCMHDHYEDCPWREQALYTYDSRNQMLYGYYLWGNWDFALGSLNLFADTSLCDNGQLRICAPTRVDLVIPMYTLVYPVQIFEHALYSGSMEAYEHNRDAIAFLVDQALASRDAATQLYCPASDEYWNYFEWAPGLAGNLGVKPDPNAPKEVHALYNLYLLEMLDAYAKLLKWDGDDAKSQTMLTLAQQLRERIETTFYDAATGAYVTRLLDGKAVTSQFHEHTQFLMLHTQSVPEDKIPRLWQALCSGTMVPVTLSVMPYVLFALLERDLGSDVRDYVQKKVEENYFPMLDGHSTTLWETIKGDNDFYFAGSLCHGWSSLPVYYCAAGLLGIKPLERGYRKFRVRPWHGHQAEVSGGVPTPSGRIEISLRRNAATGRYDLSIRCPKTLTPVVEENSDCLLGEVSIQND